MHTMTIVPGHVIRDARTAANLTQAELAERLEVSQSTIAKLESPRSNPRVSTLERALAATGNSLEVTTKPSTYPGIDESLVASCMRRAPADRLALFQGAYRQLRQLAPTVRTGE
jgi:transcriptional regulator with XRE-family HTH domain